MTGRTPRRPGALPDKIDFDAPLRRRPTYPDHPATPGLRIRHRSSGTTGTVVRFRASHVEIRTRSGRTELLPISPGALEVAGPDRRPLAVSLVQPPKTAPTTTTITASGSVAAGDTPARVARASRILVEGRHDAELVEKVWGADLRVEGVVVEPLHGADDLAQVVRTFGPRPGRRLGILLDHLVDGSKESRIAAGVDHPDVLITGHRYVDIWQAVRPAAVGIPAWPVIPRGQDWKRGVLRELGVNVEPGQFWQALLGRVGNYADLEADLVGAVEQLIDFVAPPEP